MLKPWRWPPPASPNRKPNAGRRPRLITPTTASPRMRRQLRNFRASRPSFDGSFNEGTSWRSPVICQYRLPMADALFLAKELHRFEPAFVSAPRLRATAFGYGGDALGQSPLLHFPRGAHITTGALRIWPTSAS